jgi:hypothetical protein
MKGKWVDEPFEKQDADNNIITDLRIQRFVPALKEFMSKPLPLNKSKKPHFLVLVCMFKNEDWYLDEFIRYHILQGVDFFYLYSNENKPESMTILEPYVKAGYVKIIDWPDSVIQNIPKDKRRTKWNDYKHISTQNLAFEHFTKNFKDKYRYVLKVDIDEFCVPAEGYKSVRDVLKKEFSESKTKAITIPRTDFGSNGHIKKPNGLVIESYTKCARKATHSKSIGNNKFIKEPSYGAHSFDLKD